MSQPIKHLYEFGPFRLDAGERLLLRDGESVPLTPKAFDLLLALVEHHGHLLEKDELLKLVWPDTFVEEANLSYNISLIRKALGDGENGQKYIETATKRGYRFVASVLEIADEEVSDQVSAKTKSDWAKALQRGENRAAVSSGAENLIGRIKRHKRIALLTIAAIAVAGAALGLYQLIGWKHRGSGPALKMIPLTSFSGIEFYPSFSPDGSQVAFAWNGEKEDNWDIYIKQVDAGGLLRLTTAPAEDSGPVWAPDGRYIAFMRSSSEGAGVYLTPAIGGSERKLVEVFSGSFIGRKLDYSPDGKLLAVVNKNSAEEPFSIFLLSVETGEKRKLTQLPPGTVRDSCPAFSPDGQTLAFVRRSGVSESNVYLISVTGGEPKRLNIDVNFVEDVVWTPDGREIIFSAYHETGNQRLYRIPASGGASVEIPVGLRVSSPATSRQGNRLAYVQDVRDLNVWRIELSGSTARPDTPTKFISSTQDDFNPEYSPDGKRIVFGSDRSGAVEIWLCNSDGSNATQLTSFRATGEAIRAGSPRWSPDGRQIVFDAVVERQRDIFVINANGGKPRRLTIGSSEDIVPCWSTDGQWIYFGSDRSGSLQIWKMPSAGGQATQMTKQGGFEPLESPDSKFLYYAKARNLSGIWRIPVGGGDEAPVFDLHQAGKWRSWKVVREGIYFATAETSSRPAIEFFNFATGKAPRVVALEKLIPGTLRGLDVSPDGRWLLYTQMDQDGRDIMLVENFR